MLLRRISFCLLSLLVFAIPIEHKYDKVFRFFSLKLIPQNVDLPTFFDKKIFFYPSDLAAIALFIFALFTMRSRFFAKGAIYLWIIFFLSFVSILFSPLCHYPMLYIRLLQLFTPIVLFSFLANGFEKERLTKYLFLALIAAALIQSGVGIAQYAKQGSLGLRLFGEPNEFPYFWMYGGKYWLFAKTSLQEKFLVFRSSGTFPHSNVFGGFLSISILACYSFFSTPRLRTIFAFVIPILFFAMNLSFSRSALFGWLVGTIFWLFFTVKKNGLSTTFKDSGVRTLFLSLAAAILCTASILYEPILHRGGVLNYNKMAQKSDALRLRYQDIGIQMIKDHPLYGVGFQQFSIRFLDYAPDRLDCPASGGTHNIYLYMAAETGIPSLIAFLFFLSTLFFYAYTSPFSKELASLLAIFIAFLFIGGCDFYPLLFQQGKLPFFIAAGLLGAHAHFKKHVRIEAL